MAKERVILNKALTNYDGSRELYLSDGRVIRNAHIQGADATDEYLNSFDGEITLTIKFRYRTEEQRD